MSAAVAKFPSNAFLSDVRVYEVNDDGIHGSGESPLDALATKATASGMAELLVEPANSSRPYKSAIAFPIYRQESVVSIVVLATSGASELAGVFEIWSPVGIYPELGLSSGYFGELARFQNVSSFVRFEKGSGLPGQVWSGLRSVIHDDLSNHPGFLRAAGASADSLRTAIGIPVCGKAYLSSILLISSSRSPIARGFEVWRSESDGFALESASYVSDELRLEVGTRAPADSLMHQCLQGNIAVLSDDVGKILTGRAANADSNAVASALAIPFFEADELTSVTLLLF